MPETIFRTAPDAPLHPAGAPHAARLPTRPRAERWLPAKAKAVLRPAKWRYRLATAGRRALPGALVIGAQKSGTSALFAYLRAHPSVASAMVKEVHYFDVNFGRGPNWYRAHFDTVAQMRRLTERHGAQAMAVEASPYYLAHPLVASRVHGLLPGAKLIAVLRDPVSRAISHHNHAVQSGVEPLCFDDATEIEDERIGPEVERLKAEPLYQSPGHRQFSYLARGRYAEQLEGWLALFPRDQLLVLDQARLLADPREAMRTVWRFLELPPHDEASYRGWGARTYVTEVDRHSHDRVAEYFVPHNERLWNLIGDDFGWDRH